MAVYSYLLYLLVRLIDERIKMHVKRGIGQANKMNNNPLNIRVSGNKWFGKNTKEGDTFESFVDESDGFRSGFIILYNYIGMGFNTLRKMITEYAPPSDNNPTDAYISNVSKWANVNPDMILTKDSYVPFASDIIAGMFRQEQGREPSAEDVQKILEGFQLFKTKFSIS